MTMNKIEPVAELAGAHVYRGPGRCRFEDCGAGPGSPVHIATAVERAHAEALAEDSTWTEAEAHTIAASIPLDGRPAEVTELLMAAELMTDEYDNLAALRVARARYDELLSQQHDIIARAEPRCERGACVAAARAAAREAGIRPLPQLADHSAMTHGRVLTS